MPALGELKAKFWEDVAWLNDGDFPSDTDSDPIYGRFDDDIRMKKIDEWIGMKEKVP